MDAMLFRMRVSVLWVAVAVATSGVLLVGLFAPGALEELLAGKVEGETLDDTTSILFAALGSLCATLIVHPASLKDPQIAAAVEQAIADLAYGTVSVNAFVFYSAYLATTPWGGYPGHTIRDIQSGIGKSYNFLLFDRPQKSVLRAPFQRLDPITVKAKRPQRFAKRLAYYEYEPSVGKLPGLLWAALRS